MLSWRTARRCSGFSVTAVLALGVLVPLPANADGTELTAAAPGTVAAPKAPAPAEVDQSKIPTLAAPKPQAPQHGESDTHEKPGADHVVAELTRTDLGSFSMLGVTWKSGLTYANTVVEVRWRDVSGDAPTWSEWTDLHTDPAPGEGGVPGTEPQWVGEADAAAVRVISTAGARPEGLSLSTIDPRDETASTDADDAATMSTAAATTVSKPAIISRATWGASNSGSCDSPIYGPTTRGAVIHHTAGSNTYTKSQSAGIVKATQAYHMRSRGWCDIGYNFLVDKYGQIFEGRAGGTTKPVRAAHSGNATVNQETMGVSLMGTFASTTPSAAMKTAVVNLVAWRFDDYGIAGKGTYAIGGKTLNRIAGHRNVVSTECPGAKVYAWLSETGGLRDRVVSRLAQKAPVSEVSGRLVTDVSYTRFNLAWRPVSGAAKYEAQITTSSTRPKTCSTGCRTVTPESASKPTLKVRGLSKSRTYHVWVRAMSSSGRALTSWQVTAKVVHLKVEVATSKYDLVTVPSTRKIALTGHGYGHGIGMSQYGAQGAAKAGVRYDKILSRYYPGTTLGSKSGDIRVLISQDTTDSVVIAGQSGLVFRDVAARKTLRLPTTVSGRTVKNWRIVQVASNKTQSTLQYRTTGGYATYGSRRWTGDGQFEGPSRISLVMPDGSAVKYRGAMRSAVPSKGSTSRSTVDILPIDHYVRGVIAAEMPSSWMPEALKAQAVAARSYGVRAMSSSRYYDICSTTACQVYGGQSRETASTDAAVRATAGKILRYGGKPAFTQFSSSSGGFTSAGSQPYLKAVRDPYDAWSGNANHSWTATVSASTIERAYSSIGTLKQLKVTKRNGSGDWGGRVSAVSLVGSKKTVTISGDAARWAFGLKSTWFRF